jgi:hypothetical protein
MGYSGRGGASAIRSGSEHQAPCDMHDLQRSPMCRDDLPRCHKQEKSRAVSAAWAIERHHACADVALPFSSAR